MTQLSLTFKAIMKAKAMTARRTTIVTERIKSVQMSFMKEDKKRNRSHQRRKRRRSLSIVS